MIYKLLVNMITLSRIVFSFFLANYIITESKNIILITTLFVLIGISDLVDGRLARRFDACTSVGAYLDVLADLFFLLSSGSVLVITGNYPAWMLFVIAGKFLEFWYTSYLARKNMQQHNHIFLSDRLGRKVIAAIYLLPFAVIVSSHCLNQNASLLIINIICMVLTLGACVSSLQRIIICMKFKQSQHIAVYKFISHINYIKKYKARLF